MFEWLKKLIHKWTEYANKPRYESVIVAPTGNLTEPLTPQPKLEHVEKGIVTAASVYDVRMQLDKLREESVKKEFLPEPQTHRRTVPKSYVAPAERHREAISKAMKGKASSRYLKIIKKSPNIKIEEED